MQIKLLIYLWIYLKSVRLVNFSISAMVPLISTNESTPTSKREHNRSPITSKKEDAGVTYIKNSKQKVLPMN